MRATLALNGLIKKTLLHKLKNYVTVVKVLKNPKNLKKHKSLCSSKVMA